MFDRMNLRVGSNARVEYPPGTDRRLVTISGRIESDKYSSGVGYRVFPDTRKQAGWLVDPANPERYDNTYDSGFFHPATEEATVATSKFWLVWADNGGSPTVKHPSESAARREAERLARKNPGTRFHVLASLATAGTPDIVWTQHREAQHQEEIPF